MVGLLGKPKNSCSYSKLILFCSLPNVTPYNKFQPNWMKNAKVKIFKIFDPQNFKKARTFCLVSLDPEISILLKVLVSSEVPFCPENGSTFPNVPKEKLENLVSQRRSKSRISNSTFFRSISMCIDMKLKNEIGLVAFLVHLAYF